MAHPTKLSFFNSKGMKRCLLCLSIYFVFSNMFSLSHKRKRARQRIYSREGEGARIKNSLLHFCDVKCV